MDARGRSRAAGRIALTAGLVLATAGLGGCLTPRARPQPSQAILDARAHRDVPPATACAAQPLASVSPAEVNFGFAETSLPGAAPAALAPAIAWLVCHPGVPIVILPDADNHGAPEAQAALAKSRAETVRQYLLTQGVAPAQLQILPLAAAEPAGDHVLIRAIGRRW
ncbi:OmpA family protein [Phenylobacterium hankyongense]|nr:OmpA family protein [Phenylobacterium hankyongense]